VVETMTKAKAKKVQAKSVIQIFLWGGMSHVDTWDPKPDAGYDYNGPLKAPLATNVDGIQLGGLFPELAKQADKYSLIRSMTHRNNGHETAAYLMQTGHSPGERLAYPSIGAVFSLFKSPGYQGLIPPYVVLTRPQGRFSEEGFLGPKFKPFATGGDPNAPRFEVEGVVARSITDDRQKARRELLGKVNTMGCMDEFYVAKLNPAMSLEAMDMAARKQHDMVMLPGSFSLADGFIGKCCRLTLTQTARVLPPGHCKAGRSVSAMPQLEPSKSERCVSTAFSGRLLRSTAKPWFMETISTFPVVKSFTG
jgi:hypothetical protein